MTWQGDASIGAVKESTYGTAVTVTKFVEFTDESLESDLTRVQGVGTRVGSRVDRAARRSPGKQQVAGDVTIEACSKGMGWMLEAVFGTVVSTQRATTSVYQHNFTPTVSDYLPSYTIQKGIPPLGGGATNPYTFPGCVANEVEFSLANGEILMVKTGWNGRETLTATGYAAPSYPTPIELFTFVEASITVGGSPTAATTTALATGGTAVADIRDFNLTWTNNVDDGGFNIGSAGKRGRKPALGKAGLSGSMTAEYDATTFRDAYLADTGLALVLTFAGVNIIGSGSDVPGLQIHVPQIKLDGELPKYNGGDVITQSLAFTGLDDLTNPPVRVSYVSTDVTP